MRYRDRGTQEPPEDHDCPDHPEPCECADRDAAAWEQSQIDRAENQREEDMLGYNDPNDLGD